LTRPEGQPIGVPPPAAPSNTGGRGNTGPWASQIKRPYSTVRLTTIHTGKPVTGADRCTQLAFTDQQAAKQVENVLSTVYNGASSTTTVHLCRCVALLLNT